MDGNCQFCLELDPDFSEESQYFQIWGHALPSRILWQSPEFVALPALGQLVEGYCLILPRSHVLCMGILDSQLLTILAGIEDLFRRVISCIYKTRVISFEHGCNQRGDQAGACLDHAHIHVLPVGNSIATEDVSKFIHLDWTPLDNLIALTQFADRAGPYLYFRDTVGRRFATSADTSIPSQFFRKLVAVSHGIPNQWDWRRFPQLESLSNTYHELSKAINGSVVTACQ